MASPVGGSGAVQGVAARTVTVVLPPNFPTPLRSLVALNGAGNGQIDPTTGAVTLSLLSSQTPGLTLVQDASGSVVLAGFVNSVGGSATISVKDTAVALLFFGVAGYRLPYQDQQALLDTIAKQAVSVRPDLSYL